MDTTTSSSANENSPATSSDARNETNSEKPTKSCVSWASLGTLCNPEIKAEARLMLPLFIKSTVAGMAVGMVLSKLCGKQARWAICAALMIAVTPVTIKEAIRMSQGDTAAPDDG